MRILIIEDEINIRSQIRRHLEQQGYQVDETGDGKEGLYFATEYPVDAAIVDLGLPSIPGLEIIKRICRIYSFGMNYSFENEIYNIEVRFQG